MKRRTTSTAKCGVGGVVSSSCRKVTASLLSASALIIPTQALAQAGTSAGGFDPLWAGLIGVSGLAVLASAWALRIQQSNANHSLNWSTRLAEMEAKLQKADAVLSVHPGLVLVWEDDLDDASSDWGNPKVFGGPAALASLMSFSTGEQSAAPIGRLLEALADLPLEEENAPDEPATLRERVSDLRQHGVGFAGAVVTPEGRSIEVAGRIAGDQVTLWLTDPAARMAEDSGILGKMPERTADLHGALNLLERAPLPAWRRDSSLKLIWVNRAYAAAVEATTPAVVIRDQIELDNTARQIAEKAEKEKQPVEGRVLLNIGGARRVLNVTEMPLHGASTSALCGLAIDATELEESRTALKQHTQANRRTLDAIATAVALFGPGQELTYYNAAFQKMWALDDADLIARPTLGELLDRLRHDGKLPEQADYAKWKSSQLYLYSDQFTDQHSPREGLAPDEIWHMPNGGTLRVSRSRHHLGGVLMLFEDVTEKTQLERQFNTQLRVQRATLNNLTEGIAVFSADGKLRLHNEAFEKLWRLPESQLAPETSIDRILSIIGNQTDTGQEALADIKRRATSLSPDDRLPTESGLMSLSDGRTLSFGTEPLPDGATLLHFLDVTDSREREKELKERNDLLEDIDRLKSKFVDHVSYHLRTPLATIIGFAEMLDDQMFGVLNDRQQDYVASILSASHHLRDLIGDIIDLSAVDAGKMPLEKHDVDIRALLDNAATYAALKAEDTQVKLKVECASDIGTIQADEKRLRQVLFNLLANAFSYTQASGDVILGAERSPGFVRLWVRDTGRGISHEDQPNSFEPFVSHGPSAGAGIGLALVHRLVELHGGWVQMISEEDAGTTVSCYLPLRFIADDGLDKDDDTALPAPTDHAPPAASPAASSASSAAAMEELRVVESKAPPAATKQSANDKSAPSAQQRKPRRRTRKKLDAAE